ncbi:hypothetical protein BGX38DRAFT_512321 [Terfezia claveryi]|nr:hypothetical protein BGX38DRAFT_512321 [Terfezia claveryi]
MSLKLSIPTASIIDTTDKPYTVYNILVRLPLREHTLSKRYSELLNFHQTLTTHASIPPPSSFPPKSYWPRTITSPSLTEDRRQALERYLQSILESPDPRWRNSSVWRQFLNLPPSWSAGSSSSSKGKGSIGAASGAGGIAAIASTGQPVTDAGLWLDVHRELKALLHDARLFLSKRDQAVSPAEQHESAAGAKRCIVKAGGILTALESGLKVMAEVSAPTAAKRGSNGSGNGASDLGEGEIRRRKDLLASARKEREALESLANSLASKRSNATSTTPNATAADKANLFGGARNGGGSTGGGRRVLGAPLPETERTRELDNDGVLQLQKQFLKDQDQDLESMLKTVVRQREIGQAIHQELDEQIVILNAVDQDVSRVDSKLQIGGRRMKKIS